MTATTLTIEQLSDAVIAFLKADVAIVAVVGDEIREANWMGSDFTYPALRVDTSRMSAQILNGNCEGEWFLITFSVYIFSEGRSSKAGQNLAGLVGRRFQNNRLITADFRSQPLNIDYNSPVTDGKTHWRGEVIVTGRLKEI